MIEANDSLNGSYEIKSGTTLIADYAFDRCESLTSIVIPDEVINIGIQSFHKCDSLADIIIGKGVRNVGERAFFYCENIKNVYITDIASWCSINYSDFGSYPYSEDLYLNNKLYSNSKCGIKIVEI